MGTNISWADETYNPLVGCSKISAGCANCYAEKMAYRISCNRRIEHTDVGRAYGNVVNGAGESSWRRQWSGRTSFIESVLTKPLHWRTPRKIFVVSMGDLFHESVPFDWIHEIVAIVTLCHHHQFFFLTKRSDIMQMYFAQPDLWTHHIPDAIHKFWNHRGIQEPLPGYIDFSAVTHQIIPPIPNLHLGVTVENQDNVGRIADLIRTPAAKRFLSIEPLLPGQLDLLLDSNSRKEIEPCPNERCDEEEGCCACEYTGRVYGKCKIDSIYLGCESRGPKERLCGLDDIRYIMRGSREAGVKIHVKQIPLNGKCNKNIKEWPKDFQVREV